MRKKQAAFMAIVGGITVLGIKLLAYFISNSVALLSDAMESVVNIAASGLMFFSIHISEKPTDDSHNYGHQKIEEISSMLEGLFIIAAALLIVYAAAGRFFEYAELFELNLAIGISMLATALNAGLSWFLARTARESGSAALEGDAKHLLSDVISSAGVWVGLFVVQLTGWSSMDSILAFAVAALIARMGIGLVIKSSHHLMDRSCKEEEKKMREILLRHRFHFIDFHDLKTRRHGNQVFADLHLSVDGSLSVKDAHDLTDHLEEELKEELPNMTLTIHIEPKR
ncbi:cation diffusion facilitator family transporter [Candidatus Bathyarchaeota archaeon]|jgi:cation diffusion facilitator family transporter|nr:cation diffusion facilitator family transporter [Candidatus Bathyarchaeota archaeon]